MNIPLTPWSLVRTDTLDDIDRRIADCQQAVILAARRTVEMRELRDKAARTLDQTREELRKAKMGHAETELAQLKREGISPEFREACEAEGIDPMDPEAVSKLFKARGAGAAEIFDKEAIFAGDNQRLTEVKWRQGRQLNQNLRKALKTTAKSLSRLRSRFPMSNELHTAIADVQNDVEGYAGITGDTDLRVDWGMPEEVVAFLDKLRRMKVTRPPSKQAIKDTAAALLEAHEVGRAA